MELVIGFGGIVILLFLFTRLIGNKRRVYVVVLGDIGRSPRMQYHAVSLAKAGFEVFLFGYPGSQPHSNVLASKNIHIVYLLKFPSFLQRLPKMVVFVLKTLWQSTTLLTRLLFLSKPSHILLQNPPSVPAIGICWLVSILRTSKLYIDWHNYGYTILALGIGSTHSLVAIYKWYERVFGRMSSNNICVTQAMSRDLLLNWNIRAVTMYDRPPDAFQSLSIDKKHQLFYKLNIFKEADHEGGASGQEVTTFTVKDSDGHVRYKPNRPVLLVSATSWTEDEDFSILLSAIDAYDKKSSEEASDLPSLMCVITGKGPLKQHYIDIIKLRRWSHVSVFTPWLEPDDYPRLLGCADLGVCLHRSSSGLDLPMKVVDMFGCGLPVCAVRFQCLRELVEHDKNGKVFETEEQLADQMQELLHGFPDKCFQLAALRENLKPFQARRWDEAWNETVLPMFT